MLRALGRLFRPAPIPASTWLAVEARVPWVAACDAAKQARLAALAAVFLHRKTITPIGDLVLDGTDRACLAALCCLPLLEFGEGGLAGWSQLLVYPEAFRVNRSHVDAAGVLHEWDDELIGESWDAGPLVLSWADVRSDLDDPRAGYCVAVHEMAHKLDALDGAMDGTPPCPARGNRPGRATSSAPTTRSRATWTRGTAPTWTPTPPSPRRNSSPCAPSTTSATPRCCDARCRRSPPTSNAFTARRRLVLARGAPARTGGDVVRGGWVGKFRPPCRRRARLRAIAKGGWPHLPPTHDGAAR